MCLCVSSAPVQARSIAVSHDQFFSRSAYCDFFSPALRSTLSSSSGSVLELRNFVRLLLPRNPSWKSQYVFLPDPSHVDAMCKDVANAENPGIWCTCRTSGWFRCRLNVARCSGDQRWPEVTWGIPGESLGNPLQSATRCKFSKSKKVQKGP